MKRKKFTLRTNGVLIATLGSWNACMKRIHRGLGVLSYEESTPYRQVSAKYEKENTYYVKGEIVWKSDKGKELTFLVELVY